MRTPWQMPLAVRAAAARLADQSSGSGRAHWLESYRASTARVSRNPDGSFSTPSCQDRRLLPSHDHRSHATTAIPRRSRARLERRVRQERARRRVARIKMFVDRVFRTQPPSRAVQSQASSCSRKSCPSGPPERKRVTSRSRPPKSGRMVSSSSTSLGVSRSQASIPSLHIERGESDCAGRPTARASPPVRLREMRRTAGSAISATRSSRVLRQD